MLETAGEQTGGEPVAWSGAALLIARVRAPRRAEYSTGGGGSLRLASSLAQCLAQREKESNREEEERESWASCVLLCSRNQGSICSSWGVFDQRGQGKSTAGH